MRRRALEVVLALLLAVCSLHAARAQVDTRDRSIRAVETGLGDAFRLRGAPYRARTIGEEMSRLAIPGASVAVIHEGRIAWAKGYGVTRPGGPAVTPATLFQAGSISKPIAALGALVLVERGKLALDRDVDADLRSWKVPANDFTRQRPVTLRELLSHTAGVSVHGFNGYARGETIPELTQVLDGTKPANSAPIRVTAAPGTAWSYSGGGYTIIQQLMLDVTGRPFPALLDSLVLRPLGMTRSRFDQPLPAGLLADAASPHDVSGKPLPEGAHVYPAMAAAGLWSTPSDLARYVMAVQRARMGDSGAILSQPMATQMLSPVLADYGLGVELAGTDAQQVFTKGGDTRGFVCYLAAFSRAGEGVVVMTNADRGAELTREIVRSVADTYGWASFGSTELTPREIGRAARQAVVGRYDLGRYGTFAVTLDSAGQLILESPGDPPLPLYARSESDFVELTQGTTLHFERGEKGGASGGGGTMVALGRLVIPFIRVR